MKTIAIIGCGRIAQNAHFPALSQIENVKIKYACDLIPEKAQTVKDKYPELVGEVITDYKIALADEEVEAVFVLTPNYSHYTIGNHWVFHQNGIFSFSIQPRITNLSLLSCKHVNQYVYP